MATNGGALQLFVLTPALMTVSHAGASTCVASPSSLFPLTVTPTTMSEAARLAPQDIHKVGQWTPPWLFMWCSKPGPPVSRFDAAPSPIYSGAKGRACGRHGAHGDGPQAAAAQEESAQAR